MLPLKAPSALVARLSGYVHTRFSLRAALAAAASRAWRSMTTPRLERHWALRPEAALGYHWLERPAWCEPSQGVGPGSAWLACTSSGACASRLPQRRFRGSQYRLA